MPRSPFVISTLPQTTSASSGGNLFRHRSLTTRVAQLDPGLLVCVPQIQVTSSSQVLARWRLTRFMISLAKKEELGLRTRSTSRGWPARGPSVPPQPRRGKEEGDASSVTQVDVATEAQSLQGGHGPGTPHFDTLVKN